MSGLKERLLRLKRSDSTHQEAESKPIPEPAAVNEWDVVGAAMEASEWGEFVLRRRVYEPSHRHGRYRLDELDSIVAKLSVLQQTAQAAAAKRIAREGKRGIDKARAGGRSTGKNIALRMSAPASDTPALERPEQLLFLDTETTGLGIGAGNVPFMIGIGYFEEERFIVEQMLIRNPAEELAMLDYLQRRLDRHTHLVSFNGKSFDWPIVKNRYILNRMKLEREPSYHLDFLHTSRSLWKHTMPSCRLGKVEEEQLAFTREDDVPGSLAPTLYFRYLAEQDPSVLQGVFVHNELDVLSLASLSIHLCHALEGSLPAEEMGMEEQFRLGLWLEKHGRREQADAVFDLLGESQDEGAFRYWVPLAAVYKKRGQTERSVGLWLRYVEEAEGRSIASTEPYVELAMFYEHREKNYAAALAYAELALDKLWQRNRLRRTGAESNEELLEQAELQKRIERLRQKTAAKKPSRARGASERTSRLAGPNRRSDHETAVASRWADYAADASSAADEGTPREGKRKASAAPRQKNNSRSGPDAGYGGFDLLSL